MTAHAAVICFLYMPDGEDGNVAVVVVDSNDTGESRQAKIIMTVVDAFVTISVNQQ
jgi:hypothetical protein